MREGESEAPPRSRLGGVWGARLLSIRAMAKHKAARQAILPGGSSPAALSLAPLCRLVYAGIRVDVVATEDTRRTGSRRRRRRRTGPSRSGARVALVASLSGASAHRLVIPAPARSPAGGR
jgi:hypothetical protein